MSLNNRHARIADVSMRASEVTVLVILDVSVIFTVNVVVVVVFIWKKQKIKKVPVRQQNVKPLFLASCETKYLTNGIYQ